MQDNVDQSSATGVTERNTTEFTNIFGNRGDDPDRENLDITTSDSESDHESDLEEIEAPRPVKKGSRHALPNAPQGSVGGTSHRRYQQRIDKLMNSRATDSNDEEDEFSQTGSYADFRIDGPAKGSGTKKVWTKQDAFQCLNVEFWLSHPKHQAGEEPSFDCPKADSSHPHYEWYLRLENLIHEYYDNGDPDDEDEPAGTKRERTKGESNLVRKTKNRVRDAVKAYLTGGYGYSRGSKKWYTEFLPDRADLMLVRFVDPYGAANGTISGHLQTMSRSWMAEIGGRPDTGTNGNQTRVDDNMSAVAANAAAKSITTSKEVDELKANVTNLRDQLVKKVRQMDGEQKQVVKKVNKLSGESAYCQEEINSQAVRITVCEGMKTAIDDFNKTISGLDVEIQKIVAAEVKKQLAAKQQAMPIRKPKPTPVLEDPTDKRTTPAPRHPAARGNTGARGGVAKSFPFGQSPAKTGKKRTVGAAKPANKTGGPKDGEIDWDQAFFDEE
ncbi:hypothetical protein NW757_014806 [Fusarium falciforme]|nr:hypothetical protein NW757_014806 [Fusarium falciforme]